MRGPMLSLKEALEIAAETEMFAVRRRDGKVMVTYLYSAPAVFRSIPQSRELRGAIWWEDGTLLSRPFHKFFNYKEPLVGLEEKDFEEEEEVFVGFKWDGYLLQIYQGENGPEIASRHSLNPPLVGLLAKRWLEPHHFRCFEGLQREHGPITLLLEVWDPEYPVMVRYEQGGAVVLAARRLEDGQYLLPGVHWHPGRVGCSVNLTNWTPDSAGIAVQWMPWAVRRLEGVEGFVVYLPKRNEFVKFKTPWAFRMSDFLEGPELGLVQAMLERSVDDLKAAAVWNPQLLEAIQAAENHILAEVRDAYNFGRERGWKERARVWEEARARFEGAILQAAMRGYEGWEFGEVLLEALRKVKFWVNRLREKGFFRKDREVVGARGEVS